MYEVNCFDTDGNTINEFYQWDVDQTIVLKVKNKDESYLSIKPEVHFANSKSKEALVVKSDENVSDSETIVCDVPNKLLQEAYPLSIYVYLTDAENTSSQKTIFHTQLPVRQREKPSDYYYIENITQVTADEVTAKVEARLTSTADDAVTTVSTAKTTAMSEIDAAKNNFITTGNNLVAEATSLRDSTETIYNQTVTAASTTQTQIQNDMTEKMQKNGIAVKTNYDESDCNVTLAFVIN